MPGDKLVEQTVEIVAAFVAKNALAVDQLPALVTSVHATLKQMESGDEAPAPTSPLIPAVPIKRSITPDWIISLEDGRKLKSMKRYLAVRGMTPEAYREKWGLPKDYPMVAPNYTKARSEMAKTFGLGQSGRRGKNASPPSKTTTGKAAATKSAPAKRGRPKKS